MSQHWSNYQRQYRSASVCCKFFLGLPCDFLFCFFVLCASFSWPGYETFSHVFTIAIVRTSDGCWRLSCFETNPSMCPSLGVYKTPIPDSISSTKCLTIFLIFVVTAISLSRPQSISSHPRLIRRRARKFAKVIWWLHIALASISKAYSCGQGVLGFSRCAFRFWATENRTLCMGDELCEKYI